MNLREYADVRLLGDPDPRFLILEKCGVPLLRCAVVPPWVN
ncbi:MAG TPA: hypothetical protein VNT99_11530 [Methylomirabilota bacterium]|nr:hypothetical protein [Methylomirabilota bacterium]